MFSSLSLSLLLVLQVLLFGSARGQDCENARQVYEGVTEGTTIPGGSSVDSIFSILRLQGKLGRSRQVVFHLCVSSCFTGYSS